MTKKLLIIDDDPSIIELLKLRFSILNYDVSTAENGKVALELINISTPDLVITDIKMPVMDGVTFLRNFRQSFSDIPVIIISGHLSEESIKECQLLGIERIFFKPFDNFAQIKNTVNILLSPDKTNVY